MNADELVAEVRARGISTAQLSDDNLDTIIGGVLRVYNRYRPRHLHSTLTTVQYQGEYEVDADATRVIEVFWGPSSNSDVISRIITELRMIETDFHYPSLLTIFHINKDELRKTMDGQWTMHGNSVRLQPVPTQADLKVPYIYAADWEMLEDVPGSDSDLLVEGAVKMANVSVARARVGSAGWQAGDYKVDGTAASKEIERAENAVTWWQTRLAGGGVGSTS